MLPFFFPPQRFHYNLITVVAHSNFWIECPSILRTGFDSNGSQGVGLQRRHWPRTQFLLNTRRLFHLLWQQKLRLRRVAPLDFRCKNLCWWFRLWLQTKIEISIQFPLLDHSRKRPYGPSIYAKTCSCFYARLYSRDTLSFLPFSRDVI